MYLFHPVTKKKKSKQCSSALQLDRVIAMVTTFSSHIFNEKVMGETQQSQLHYPRKIQ